MTACDEACPRCERPLAVFELCLGGADVVLRSCSECDRRWWLVEGEEVELADLLGHDLVYQPALRDPR